MTKAKNDKRAKERAKSNDSQEIRGMFTNVQSNKQRPFLLWDVSENGIGIWSDTELTKNAQLVLTIGQPFLMVLETTVRWCEKQGDHHGFRVGLSFKTEQKKVLKSLSTAFNKTKNPQAS